MKVYLVGGAVRDRLLGLPVHERDWVVVGASPLDLIGQGYRQVGKDFPVFIHPVTHEEFALARTERKTAPGYSGFLFHTSPEVTLEEDLGRRDLTINAMAEDEAGAVIDPYGGRDDLDRRLLRHVSEAFIEDPVRILRVARFMSRFKALGFKVAPETMDMMRCMVQSGEVNSLVPERVFAELNKALVEPAPAAFFQTLRACGALHGLFPEIDALFGVPQPIRERPEVDIGVHTLLVLEQAAKLSDKPNVRFAALLHDLGKGVTNSKAWPKHPGYERRGVALVQSLCQRVRVPVNYRRLAERVARYHGHAHRAFQLSSGAIVDLLKRIDAIRQPEGFDDFLLAVKADARGRPGYEQDPYPQADFLRAALKAARDTALDEITSSGLRGQDLALAIRDARIQSVARVRSSFPKA